MQRVLLLLAAGATVGCSGDPPPVREATPVSNPDAPRLTEFNPPAKPDKSDPAAAKLLADAVAAHAGTDGATLAKLKAVTITRTGLTNTTEGTRAQLTWQADLLAPDRHRVEATIRQPQQLQQFTLIVTATAGSMSAVGQPKVLLAADDLRDCHMQRREDELMLLYPLADPATVAVPAPAATVNGKPARGAYVWTPALSPALVHFDDSARLVRVVYRGLEHAREVPKEITITAFDRFDGVLLPTKYELRANGRVFIDIEKQTYEIGKTFDPSRFVP